MFAICLICCFNFSCLDLNSSFGNFSVFQDTNQLFEIFLLAISLLQMFEIYLFQMLPSEVFLVCIRRGFVCRIFAQDERKISFRENHEDSNLIPFHISRFLVKNGSCLQKGSQGMKILQVGLVIVINKI